MISKVNTTLKSTSSVLSLPLVGKMQQQQQQNAFRSLIVILNGKGSPAEGTLSMTIPTHFFFIFYHLWVMVLYTDFSCPKTMFHCVKWTLACTGLMTEKLQVQIPVGAVGEFSSPWSTFCADSYFIIRSTLVLPQ